MTVAGGLLIGGMNDKHEKKDEKDKEKDDGQHPPGRPIPPEPRPGKRGK